ncbi:MAG: AAA family ATPase [Firmicutes bacterium]|nr:AAA family ATPase [Bacillota bacterium]
MTKENVVLIGFMGSGKTVIGRQTARLLGYEFVDADEEIQRVTGLSLHALYKKHGEIRFRSEEELMIKKLAVRRSLVIACGGSLMLEKEPIALLKEFGWFVLLHAEADVILERVSRKNSRSKRPLLSDKPNLEQVRELLIKREQQYRGLADYTLNNSEIGVEEAAAKIAGQYRQECQINV